MRVDQPVRRARLRCQADLCWGNCRAPWQAHSTRAMSAHVSGVHELGRMPSTRSSLKPNRPATCLLVLRGRGQRAASAVHDVQVLDADNADRAAVSLLSLSSTDKRSRPSLFVVYGPAQPGSTMTRPALCVCPALPMRRRWPLAGLVSVDEPPGTGHYGPSCRTTVVGVDRVWRRARLRLHAGHRPQAVKRRPKLRAARALSPSAARLRPTDRIHPAVASSLRANHGHRSPTRSRSGQRACGLTLMAGRGGGGRASGGGLVEQAIAPDRGDLGGGAGNGWWWSWRWRAAGEWQR